LCRCQNGDLYVADVRLAAADRAGTIVEVVRGTVSATSKNGSVELGDVTIRRAPRTNEEA
jgi:hypothetical protein